jgi:predicted dehydrogenase
MLRFGFIGLGAMGMSHIKIVAELCRETAEISAVCSANADRLREVHQLAPRAKIFRHESELIASPLDAIFVSTPNFTHVSLALEILEAGKHLFLEKPCGITADECHRLADAVENTGQIVMIGHELRYSPYFRKIKELVNAGEIGRPQMVWCREFRGPFQKKTRDWIEDNTRSGGTLVDKNCHHFDLMNWWADSKPKRVCAFGGNAVNRVIDGPNQANDHATVSFEYANNVRGTLHLCLFALDFPKEDLEMGIIGDKGLLQTRISNVEILQWKRGAKQSEPKVHSITAKPGLGWGSHLGSEEIHQDFIDCILNHRQPLTSVRACLDATLLAIAAEQSIRDARIVEL